MKAPLQFYQGTTVCFESPDYEWLKHHYHTLGKTQEQIAAEVGCTRWWIKKWVKELGLRKKLKDSRFRYKVPTKEWLEHQYLALDKSIRDIADEKGCSVKPVIDWLRLYDIQKPREQLAETHSERMSGKGNPAWNGGTARNYHRNALKRSGRLYQCEWCGHTRKLHVHHRDNDATNGDLDNLAWMCYNCNLLEAHLRGLQQKGRADILIETNQITIRFNT
jgi:hypothetical protein